MHRSQAFCLCSTIPFVEHRFHSSLVSRDNRIPRFKCRVLMKERTAFSRILESNFRWMIVLMAAATGSFLSDTLASKTRNDALSREKMRGEWAHGYSSNRFSVRNTRNLLPLLEERLTSTHISGSSFRNFSLAGWVPSFNLKDFVLLWCGNRGGEGRVN